MRPPSRYTSSVWKLSLGNYLCYVTALGTRMLKFISMFTLWLRFLITTSFTLVAALQLSLLCMWMENLNSLFVRHSNFRTHVKFSLRNLNLRKWLQLWKRSQFNTRSDFDDILILFLSNLSIVYALTLLTRKFFIILAKTQGTYGLESDGFSRNTWELLLVFTNMQNWLTNAATIICSEK